MRQLVEAYFTLIKILMALCMAGMVVLVFGNVVLRYAFNSGITVSEEMSRLFFVWMCFLGAILGLRERAHLGVDTLVARLPRAGKMAWPAFGLIVAPFAIFAAFALPAAYDPAATAAEDSIHDPLPFDAAVLAETVHSQGKPVFVWFTADWCVTCKVNERVAIEREAVREAFAEAGVVTMRGDWTRRDPAITAFLAERGVAGVPLYLWYSPGRAPEQLPQVLTAAMLVERAQGLGQTGGTASPARPAGARD